MKLRIHTSLLAVGCLLGAVISAEAQLASTVWNPAANPSSTGLWSQSANWTGGAVPGSANKVVFNVPGADGCVINGAAIAGQVVAGDNGPGGTLTIASGGSLTTSATNWCAIGYNNTNVTVVENGGSVAFGYQLWIGLNSGSDGALIMNGGTVTVSNMFGLGWSGGKGTAQVNAGTLNLLQWNATRSINPTNNSVLDIGAGTVVIAGNQIVSVSNYVSTGKITAHGGPNVEYRYDSGTGKTIVKAANTNAHSLTVIRGSGSGSYTNGAHVSITAEAPRSGEIFTSWAGDTGTVAQVNQTATTLTMPGTNITVTATYRNTNDTSILPLIEMQDIAYASEQSEVEVSWKSFKGGQYEVHGSQDLAQWSTLASNYPPSGAAGALTTFAAPAPSNGSLYRVSMPVAKPNVLLIIGDDLRDLSALPGPNTNRVIMPNLERLAARSMRFDRAFCQYPVCNPSRTSFLTGLRPDATGVLDNSTFFRNTSISNTVTLPQLFRQNGYQTVSLGKVFHNVSTDTIDWQSWDVCKILTDPSYAIDAIGKTGASNNMTGGAFSWCYWISANGNDDNQMDGKIALDATDRLSQTQTKPFFMAVGLNKPHDPYIAPAKYFALHPTNQLNVHVDPANRSNDVSLAIPPGTLKAAFAAFTDQERLEFLRAYYGCASFEDAQIGRLLDALDQNGWWQNTIVIFIGDHGYHLGERDWWNKVTIFELCSRVPMYVYAPGVTSGGQRCTRLVELIDLYPTLADLAGLALPSALPGTSFRPLLGSPQLPWKPAAYTQVLRGSKTGYSVRTEQWRYTRWSTGESELYDHQSDEGEWYNLASNPAYSHVVNQLAALLPP